MSENVQTIDQKNDQALNKSLNLKTKYLRQLQDAVSKHDDLMAYKLLDITKYYHVIKKERYTAENDYTALIKDLRPELSHHLSRQLIKYLRKTYPFFYYHEDELGHYQIYFGDWWGHKLFGYLDIIDVKFNFKNSEYVKLKQAFNNQQISSQNMKTIQRQNKALQRLITTKDQRTNQESELKSDLKANNAQSRMPWNSSRIKANHSAIISKLKSLTNQDKRANDAKGQIESNQKKLLTLSKENTVINYEKQCIKKYFGDLKQFNENNKQLYYNYVSHLLVGGKD